MRSFRIGDQRPRDVAMQILERLCESGVKAYYSGHGKLMEATKLLASAGLPLLAEEVEELAVQVDLRPPTNLSGP
jgi:hypothetical protein